MGYTDPPEDFVSVATWAARPSRFCVLTFDEWGNWLREVGGQT